jgi:serine O-acetyltransferase
MDAIKLHRIARYFYLKKVPFLPTVFQKIIWLIHKSRICKEIEIGRGTRLMGGGVMMNHLIKIGRNVYIGEGVTIGGRGYGEAKVPVIGNNVHIAPGAMILGPITIGDNVAIGANAVVIKSVPSNSFVAGCPAKIMKGAQVDKCSRASDFPMYFQYF